MLQELTLSITGALVASSTIAGDTVGVLEGTHCIVDIDSNGDVNGGDLGLLLIAWGSSNAAADLDGSGTVDGGDNGFTSCCLRRLRISRGSPR